MPKTSTRTKAKTATKAKAKAKPKVRAKKTISRNKAKSAKISTAKKVSKKVVAKKAKVKPALKAKIRPASKPVTKVVKEVMTKPAVQAKPTPPPVRTLTKQREKELQEVKEILLQQKAELLEHLESLSKDSDSELSQLGGDEVDIASIEISQAALQKMGSREQKLLKKINHALDKFETGDFGICELTGEEIPAARLRARPVAQYTVEAKMELERRERQFRDPDSAEEDGFSYDEE